MYIFNLYNKLLSARDLLAIKPERSYAIAFKFPPSKNAPHLLRTTGRHTTECIATENGNAQYVSIERVT